MSQDETFYKLAYVEGFVQYLEEEDDDASLYGTIALKDSKRKKKSFFRKNDT